VLQEIQGRSTDFVVAENGTVMHGLAVIYPIRDIKGIAAFKVTQHSTLHTVVQIVPDENCPADAEAIITAGVLNRLGNNVKVEVERVSEILPEKSGKFRYIVSHVDIA
jgi:phenylacetate-CoA ligase